MPLIVLWDIDHTLIENSGVSKEIYAATFTALAGLPPSAPVVTEGRTDRSIMTDLFRRHHLEPPRWAAIEQALAETGAAHASELRRRGYVLPGAREVLEALAGEPGAVSSVLTGNIAANALVKLRAFGLDVLVDLTVGAYGADCEDRSALVPVARRRISAAYALPASAPVLLVGDTPRDVQAALLNGDAVLAVASGSYSQDALHAAGAPVVLPDLRDTARVLAILRELAQADAAA
ncbi:HAD family hydrolase [Streptacidiphilus melanogenes]|uniref:HAD family hydrolase n=1 Tax=Streptacidiphilus melanogenes TaxID=411235 RepID=UPI0005A7DFFC|nr:haloacid dehalogenase-like hydrolase [Streptacidiphilus melanogenes]